MTDPTPSKPAPPRRADFMHFTSIGTHWADNDAGTRLYRVGEVLDLLARRAADPRGWAKRDGRMNA